VKKRWISLSRLFLGTLLLASLFSLSLVHSASAHALSLESLACEGNHHTSYDPALTNTPQTMTITTDEAFGLDSPNVGACIVVGAPITGGTRHLVSTLTLSCTQLLSNNPNIYTYLWNTGASSTVNYQIVEVIRGDSETVLTRTGSVTAGFGSGDTAVSTTTFVNTALDACFTTGVTELSGPGTLAFTPI
jgi:hypothetical protein